MTPYEIHERLMESIEENTGVTSLLGMPARIRIPEENLLGVPAGEYKQENGIWVLVDKAEESKWPQNPDKPSGLDAKEA